MIGNIVVEIIVSGQIQYREALQRHHGWLVSYIAELEADILRKKVESERRARQILVRQEKERIERLLVKVTALQQADCIRSYVATMSERHGNMAISKKAFDKCASWALSQADRIDPTKTLSFLKDVK
jgi:regulator of protease activity HflC (stomatin/prohibitin superfamily)